MFSCHEASSYSVLNISSFELCTIAPISYNICKDYIEIDTNFEPNSRQFRLPNEQNALQGLKYPTSRFKQIFRGF